MTEPNQDAQKLTEAEAAELERLMAAVLLPSFTLREREIATAAAKIAYRAGRAAGDMTKAELLTKLEALIAASPDEEGHMEADRLLLEHINDPEITEMYNRIGKWYA